MLIILFTFFFSIFSLRPNRYAFVTEQLFHNSIIITSQVHKNSFLDYIINVTKSAFNSINDQWKSRSILTILKNISNVNSTLRHVN